jgi:hypothetical protein
MHKIYVCFLRTKRERNNFRNENCVLLDYYAAISGNFLPTFRDNLSIPLQKDSLTSRKGPICCLEKAVRNCHYSLHNNTDERSSLLLRGGSLKLRNVRTDFQTKIRFFFTRNVPLLVKTIM